MTLEVFRTQKCTECGRLAQELSPCPWCGAGIGPDSGTVLRLLALLAGLAILLIPSRPDVRGALLAAGIVSSVLFAAAAPAHKARVSMAFAAVAVSGLCHAFPEAMADLSVKLRLHAEWLISAAALIAACGAATRLPPVPADSKAQRLAQFLKTPLALAAAAAVASAAARASAGPPSMTAMALCCASVLSALRPGAAACTVCLVIFELAFMIPAGDSTSLGASSAVFAAALCIAGIVQTCLWMKRSGPEPSSHS